MKYYITLAGLKKKEMFKRLKTEFTTRTLLDMV
jgi:hypothetical protein